MFRIMLYHIILTGNNVITSQVRLYHVIQAGNNAKNNAILCHTD